ncbi:unnamed protein product, partial [Oppiella nova]
MLSPREGPTQLELPSRPFGLILPPDRRNSFLNDNQSIAGSIILRPTDSVSLAQTSRTGSEVGSVSDFDNNEQSKLQRSISIYDNVDIHECIEAAKWLSAVDSPQHRPRSRESRTLSAHSQEVETHSQTDVKSDVKEITEKNESENEFFHKNETNGEKHEMKTISSSSISENYSSFTSANESQTQALFERNESKISMETKSQTNGEIGSRTSPMRTAYKRGTEKRQP